MQGSTQEHIAVFKASSYDGLKGMLAVGRKQEILVLEAIGLSNGLNMEGIIRIKTLNLGNLYYSVAQGRKSARSRTEGENDGFIFSYLCWGVKIWEWIMG